MAFLDNLIQKTIRIPIFKKKTVPQALGKLTVDL